MAPAYIGKLLWAIHSIFRPRLTDRSLRLLQLVLLFPFLSCQSILEMIETFGLPRDATYKASGIIRWQCVQAALRREGYRRLRNHLQKLKKSSTATRSREAVTLVTDDSTHETRGHLCGITGNFYNGAVGKVTLGINLQGLMAVIGDGNENIILDARIVLPKPFGRGCPPMKRTDWLIERIENLEARMQCEGLSLAGCIASINSAYGTQRVNAALARIHVPLVSQMHSGRVLSGVLYCQFMVSCPAGLFLALW